MFPAHLHTQLKAMTYNTQELIDTITDVLMDCEDIRRIVVGNEHCNYQIDRDLPTFKRWLLLSEFADIQGKNLCNNLVTTIGIEKVQKLERLKPTYNDGLYTYRKHHYRFEDIHPMIKRKVRQILTGKKDKKAQPQIQAESTNEATFEQIQRVNNIMSKVRSQMILTSAQYDQLESILYEVGE